MSTEHEHATNGRSIKVWAPLLGLGLCTTWFIYLVATQIKQGFSGLDLAREDFAGRILLAPVQSLGATGSYLLLACLGSLCFLLWSRKRIDQIPRRAIGLPLLLLALSALCALIEGDSQIWGGSFGGILERSFLFFGKPLAILMAAGLLVFGLVMSRDWFFYDHLRQMMSGGAAAPAFALGMGHAGQARESSGRGGRTQALQVGTEPGDDLDISLDFDSTPFNEGLTAVAARDEDDDDPLADIPEDSLPVASHPEPRPFQDASDEVKIGGVLVDDSDGFEIPTPELSNQLLTRGPEDRKKLPEIDAEVQASDDDEIEEFLAEESSEEIAEDGAIALDELPELDWSETIDEPSDADLFAELDVNHLEAPETVAEEVKESEMFASTETPVLDEPVIGWDDEDEDDDVDWDDDDDSDDDDDDYDDDEDEDEDDEDEDEDDDDYGDDDEDDYDDDYGDDDDDDDDYRDSHRQPLVASHPSVEAAPAASISFSLTEDDIEQLFEEEEAEAPVAETHVEEPAASFPALDVDEDELFELDQDDSLESVSWDSVDENPEIEIQSLLFPEEESTPAPELAEPQPQKSRKPEKDRSSSSPRAITPSLLNLDEDWAPWGEDSTPARPAAMMSPSPKPEVEAGHELSATEDELEVDAAEIVTSAMEVDEVTFASEEDEDVTEATELAADEPTVVTEATELTDEETTIAAEIVETREAEVAATPEANVEIADQEEDEAIEPLLESQAAETSDEMAVEDEDEIFATELDAESFGDEIDADSELEFEPAEFDAAGFEFEDEETESLKPQAGPGPKYGLEFGDPLYEEAARLCLGRDTCRISFLQRNLDVDFARAAALIERMEAEGLVGPYSASGQHEILVSLDDWLANR